VALPPGVVTEICPLLAPLGTVAEMVCPSTTVKVAVLLPNITLEAPVKLVPVIVICAPTGPLSGLKPVTVGVATKVKFVTLRPMPPGVVTEIGPLLAFAGTLAMIFMPLNLKPALAPLNATCIAPFRLLPLIVTAVPTPPLAGVKLLMVGGAFATTVKLELLVAVPPPVVTPIGPLVALEGTVAVI